MDFKAFIQLEFQNGNKFRWAIPEKYAWKIFLDRWTQYQKQSNSRDKEEEDNPFKKMIRDLRE